MTRGFGRGNAALLAVVIMLGIGFMVRTSSTGNNAAAVAPTSTAVPPATPAPAPAEPTSAPAPPTTEPTPTGLASDGSVASATAAPADSKPLAAPLLAADGTAVFDVRRSTGERLRVAVPPSLSNGFTSMTDNDNGVTVDGPAGSLAISFASCIDDWGRAAFSWATNRVGARVFIDGMTAAVCRSAEELTARLDTTEPLDDVPDLFDVRIVASGPLHDAALADSWLDRGDCRCLPFGPMVFADAGVVVNSTGAGRFTAVDQSDLTERWSTEPADAELVEGPDGMYLTINGGDFVRLDPVTGDVVWRMSKATDEAGLVLDAVADKRWLLRSSFWEIDDDRAPLVRLIDVETGQVQWAAEGRPSAGWKFADPVTIDGRVVLMDRSDDPQPGTNGRLATLRAYDIENGELAWTTELGATTPAIQEGALASFDFEADRGLFARSHDGVYRINPTTGEVRWQIPNDGVEFDGTDYDSTGSLALALRVDDGVVLVDPDTGDETQGDSTPGGE